MARDPTIAYVLLRNAHFGPQLASSVELCVRDVVRHSRYAGSSLVVCPKVERPFEGIPIKHRAGCPAGRQIRQGLELSAGFCGAQESIWPLWRTTFLPRL